MAHKLESALQLFVCQPDRPTESAVYFGGTAHRVIPKRKPHRTRFTPLSPELFMMAGASGSTPASRHNSADHPGAAGSTNTIAPCNQISEMRRKTQKQASREEPTQKS